MYPLQWAWEQVRFTTPDEDWTKAALDGLFAKAAPQMLVFDTWVDQQDHDDHPHNIVWGHKSASEQGLVYLDFARTLGLEGAWQDGGWRGVTRAPFPRKIESTITDEDLGRAIKGLLALPQESIRTTVMRIPDDYLDPEEKALIVDGLLGRRDLLVGALL